MHVTTIITSPQNVVNKNYGKQPCAARTLCRFQKQSYAVAPLCWREAKTLCLSKKQPYAAGQPCAADAKTLCLSLRDQPSWSSLCSE